MRQLSDKSSVVNSFYFALVSFESFVFEGRGVCVSVEVFQFNGTTSQGIQILWIPVATGLHARFVKLGIITIPWKELLCSSGIQVTQNSRKWPSHFNIQPRDKKIAAVSRLGASIDWSIRFGALGIPHPNVSILTYPSSGLFDRVWVGVHPSRSHCANWTRWFFLACTGFDLIVAPRL